ncbi:MAG: hypothetical protein J3K34DRAFT_3284 [Monoraphidium minutum]|nr:MAG: hypothetical protein J3K34DRAFT_3284 [Monoraphidium minutum]
MRAPERLCRRRTFSAPLPITAPGGARGVGTRQGGGAGHAGGARAARRRGLGGRRAAHTAAGRLMCRGPQGARACGCSRFARPAGFCPLGSIVAEISYPSGVLEATHPQPGGGPAAHPSHPSLEPASPGVMFAGRGTLTVSHRWPWSLHMVLRGAWLLVAAAPGLGACCTRSRCKGAVPGRAPLEPVGRLWSGASWQHLLGLCCATHAPFGP